MIGIDINGGNVKIHNLTGSDIEIINSSRPGVTKRVIHGQKLSLGFQQKSEIDIKHGDEVEAEVEVEVEPHETTTMTAEQIDQMIAEAAEYCHEANREYCEAIGDVTQTPWEVAPDWQKESAIAGVKAIWANPETTPEESHLGWLEQKMADGWRYGEIKDIHNKTHPCMVEYSQLPEEQRAKDTIFGCVARISMGLEVPEYLDVAYKAIFDQMPEITHEDQGLNGQG